MTEVLIITLKVCMCVRMYIWMYGRMFVYIPTCMYFFTLVLFTGKRMLDRILDPIVVTLG